MIANRFVLAASMVVLVAMSGHAYAGTTISDKRYWPDEVGTTDQSTALRRENAFGLAGTRGDIEATEPSYRGGPKEND